ncbi:hypothetical protein A3860_12345 [Niastella vici]|uniref:DUF4267 domain-containing protein n=1 Tax=Niastella vici TaxID=1703345 RepID=A0A1V9G6S9_9BACT|nr:DUF4267 domain-containing protein [Niastella vici]OQP66287.1 hypothetical protein A3860_12345 [Niastella vici]
MKNSAKNFAFWTSILTGALLLFIGGRFFAIPEPATTAYGIHVPTNGDFSFQYIKGIRDIFTGAILLVLLFAKEFRALGIALLVGCMIPMVDFSIVLTHPGSETARLYPHLSAVLISLPLGIYYLRTARVKKV